MSALLSKLLKDPAGTLREHPEVALIPGFFVLVVGGWEILIRALEVPVITAPAPSDIVKALGTGLSNGELLRNGAVTIGEALLGFVCAAVLGLVVGSVIAQFRLVERTLYPYLIAIQTTPKVAIAPLFIVWFGFGITSKVIMAAIVAFFPILVNVITGLRSADQNKIELLRSLGATRWQTFRMVRLPNALPMIFAGFNIAIVFSILGAIVGEFVGSKAGLGNLILQKNFNLDTPGVFAVLLCLSAMGITLHVMMQWIRRKVLFWAETEHIASA